MSRSLNDSSKPFFNVKEPPGYEYNPQVLQRVRSGSKPVCDNNNCLPVYGSGFYNNQNSGTNIQASQPTKYLACDPVRRPNYL